MIGSIVFFFVQIISAAIVSTGIIAVARVFQEVSSWLV